MATFNANVTPISDIILSQVVGVYADVAAADSTMTIYHDGNPTAKWYFPWSYRNNEAVPATIMVNLAIGGAWPTANWTTAVPTAPVTVPVNFLKTYTQITSKYGPPSPV